MSHSYWLAVGLLAQVPLTEGPEVPQFTPLNLDVDLLALDTRQNLDILATQVKFPLPTAEWFAPEFSALETFSIAQSNPYGNRTFPTRPSRWFVPSAMAASAQPQIPQELRTLQASQERQWTLVNGKWELTRPLVIKRQPTPPAIRPASGSQLYEQRLTALKAGQIYTRLSADSYASAWTKATAQPSHEDWKYLLALEARAIASGQGSNKLNIMLGDSLSMWFPTERLPTEGLWLNQGVSGETTTHILSRIAQFKSTQPQKIYLLAGINDLRNGASDATILSNFQEIIRQLRQNHPESQLVVQSILPTRLPALGSSRIRALNDRIEAIALQYGGTYLDLHSHFSDDQGILRLELTTDGIHLSVKGYELWQQLLSVE
ncbi:MULTISPECIES: GDSL-type esterase/lipase family protein [Desertifilum]|uniref:SGNH hydrolase-type esterase domain-containing protein n=1 Tax=Desertifilum tharense IPPAS B-1220 TaxID=1781255 RepID=A0A1E5QDH8_9CYAN|nr:MULTISPECIES: GDSL-type esterase/lipase family protein [Desertifilum]MDA0213634.1 GDSL-type esterase/lipase family protein [Cyanobacteria bacterium FC1]OEJ72709.1 hypothetical protein BH720_23580 [Desertifilum tharense IPPAS B-1220]